MFGDASIYGMTIALAIKARDGILVGADKRETSTKYVSRKSDYASKVYRMGRNCVIALSGDGGVGATFLEQFGDGPPNSDRDHWMDCRELADSLAARVRIEEAVSSCHFLVCGYRRDAEGKHPSIKRVAADSCGAYPTDCISGVADCGSLGRDWLLYYYRCFLGIEFEALALDELLKPLLFILAQTAASVLDVGPQFDLYELREDSCSAIVDYSAALSEVAELSKNTRGRLRAGLLS